VSKSDYIDEDDCSLIYYGDFNFGSLNPREFFTDDIAIVYFEITYTLSEQDYEQPVLDLDFRRELWQTRNTHISDVTIKVDGREIKVSETSFFLDLTF
jgi:hypothetical protein